MKGQVIHLDTHEPLVQVTMDTPDDSEGYADPSLGIALASVLAASAGGIIALWWHLSHHRGAFGVIDGDDAELAMVKPKGKRKKKKAKGKVRQQDTEASKADILE